METANWISLVADNLSDDVPTLLGNGDGTFGFGPTIPTGSKPFALAVADFNGDGAPDLVVTNYNDNNLSILLHQAITGAREMRPSKRGRSARSQSPRRRAPPLARHSALP